MSVPRPSVLPLATLMLGLAVSAYGSGSAQTVAAADLLAALPPAPSGWSAGTDDSLSGSAAGTDVSRAERRYTGPDGASATVEYTASEAMVAASRSAGSMFQNRTMVDMMNRNNPDKTIAAFDREGWTGWSIVDTAEDFSEVTAFNETIVAQIEIDRGDADSLAAFVDAIDWEALGALAADG